jgi:signal peptidase I
MTNTLQNGEKLVLSGVVTNPDYGDIVVIRRENDTPLIKRVIGLPGDKIFIDDNTGLVYRNGQALDEPYIRDGFTPSRGLTSAYTVPEGGIFVLGDHRKESLDSRMLRDQISMNDVVGVVTFRLNPFESLRKGD